MVSNLIQPVVNLKSLADYRCQDQGQENGCGFTIFWETLRARFPMRTSQVPAQHTVVQVALLWSAISDRRAKRGRNFVLISCLTQRF